ncbi:MAG TPA: serine peptidase precursor, partial [Candidatus Cloacimonadota bacterium]|nr:serine peptidase precursor [Candidatus Cloacimonadota bacterium]
MALIRSLHPDWSTAQVINQFKATCDDVNALNPGLENLLGAGKINAFRALGEVNPSQSPQLHLAMFELGTPTDTNANSAVEPGESFQLNFTLRNYSDFSAQVQIALTCTSPYVVINQASHSAMIPADYWLDITDAFDISVQEDTPSSYLGFTITITSETPILSGSTQSFNILVHNGGSFVWEAKAGARNQSGAFIRDALLGMGKDVVYGTSFPASFHSFDAVYLSFGAVDANVGRFSSLTMYGALRNYLEAGG